MHWRNSSFQVLAFIVGKCHTSDEMYRKLLELREERDLAVKSADANVLRTKAKRIRLNKELNEAIASGDEIAELEAQADLMEMDAFKEQGDACYSEALRERDYIDMLIAKVEPHRKYADLPLHEANQIIQMEEWKEELKWRADNFLLSQGSIPHDHFETMRLHPQWKEEIKPVIEYKIAMIRSGQVNDSIMLEHKCPVPEIQAEFDHFLTLEYKADLALENKVDEA